MPGLSSVPKVPQQGPTNKVASHCIDKDTKVRMDEGTSSVHWRCHRWTLSLFGPELTSSNPQNLMSGCVPWPSGSLRPTGPGSFQHQLCHFVPGHTSHQIPTGSLRAHSSLAYLGPEYTWLEAGVGSRPGFVVYLKMLVRPKEVVTIVSPVAECGWDAMGNGQAP